MIRAIRVIRGDKEGEGRWAWHWLMIRAIRVIRAIRMGKRGGWAWQSWGIQD